jgi:hypothetical protein
MMLLGVVSIVILTNEPELNLGMAQLARVVEC